MTHQISPDRLVSCPTCTNEYHSRENAHICAAIEKNSRERSALLAVAEEYRKLVDYIRLTHLDRQDGTFSASVQTAKRLLNK